MTKKYRDVLLTKKKKKSNVTLQFAQIILLLNKIVLCKNRKSMQDSAKSLNLHENASFSDLIFQTTSFAHFCEKTLSKHIYMLCGRL